MRNFCKRIEKTIMGILILVTSLGNAQIQLETQNMQNAWKPMPITVNYFPLKVLGLKPAPRKGPTIAIERRLPPIPELQLLMGTFNLHKDIYGDIDPKSNTFYYLPEQFGIKWDHTSNEYGFKIHYLEANDKKKGGVLVSMELTANIRPDEILLAEQIISSKLGKKVKLLPMDLPSVPEFEYNGLLGHFEIDENSAGFTLTSDYLESIPLNWRMNSSIDGFISAMLRDAITKPEILFTPSDKEEKAFKKLSVLVNLAVNSENTYGKLRFQSPEQFLKGWTNILDYPISPKTLTVLIKSHNNYRVETFAIPSNQLESGEVFNLSDPSIGKRLRASKNIIGMWLDYSLISDCDSCNKIVKRKLIGGTTGSEIGSISIQSLQVFEYAGATTMRVFIKSKQVDPKGEQDIEIGPFTLMEDGQIINDIEMFVPQGDQLDYSYRVELVMGDGTTLRSKSRDGNSSLLVLGEKQIKRLFPDKKKDELIDNAKNGAIEKLKDTILGKDVTEEELIDKGFSLISGLFKKKDSTKTKKQKKKEKNDKKLRNNENLDTQNDDKPKINDDEEKDKED